MKGIYALYADADSAQRAVDGLRAAGIAERAITVVSSEPIEESELSRRDKATWLHWIAACGGLGGLLAGAWLTSMTETAWPLQTGNMPIVAWWPNLIVMFELTMLGGIVATVTALLVTAMIPGRDSTLYDADVSDGQILIGVENPPEISLPALERALLAGGGARLRTIG